MRQIKGKEMRLLLDPADNDQRFAKIRLAMTRRMAQGYKHLLTATLLAAHIVFDDGVAAVEPTFITEPLKNALGRMALLAWTNFVLGKPFINIRNIWIKPGPPDWRRPPIPGRLRIRQHL